MTCDSARGPRLLYRIQQEQEPQEGFSGFGIDGGIIVLQPPVLHTAQVVRGFKIRVWSNAPPSLAYKTTGLTRSWLGQSLVFRSEPCGNRQFRRHYWGRGKHFKGSKHPSRGAGLLSTKENWYTPDCSIFTMYTRLPPHKLA